MSANHNFMIFFFNGVLSEECSFQLCLEANFCQYFLWYLHPIIYSQLKDGFIKNTGCPFPSAKNSLRPVPKDVLCFSIP